MTNKQLESIHRIIHPSVIASKGFNRNWPEGLRYGNHKYCGLDILDYRVEQRLSKIQLLHTLLLHPKHKILMQGSIEWYHIAAGLKEQILVTPFIQVNYVNRIWLQDLLNFMESSQISIFTTTFLTTTLQRKYGKSIISEVSKLNLSKQSNVQINACRLFLQVATLSDISNPDVKTVNYHFFEGTKPLSPSSTLRWPNQPPPSPKAWHLWRRILRKIFNINENNSLQIHQHVSQWIVPHSFRQMNHR